MITESASLLSLSSLQSVLQLAAGMNGAILAFRDVIHLPIRIERERIQTILRLYQLRLTDEDYRQFHAALGRYTAACAHELEELASLERAERMRWIVPVSLAFMGVEILALIASSVHEVAISKTGAWIMSLFAFAPVAWVLWEGWRCHRDVLPLRRARIEAGAH